MRSTRVSSRFAAPFMVRWESYNAPLKPRSGNGALRLLRIFICGTQPLSAGLGAGRFAAASCASITSCCWGGGLAGDGGLGFLIVGPMVSSLTRPAYLAPGHDVVPALRVGSAKERRLVFRREG